MDKIKEIAKVIDSYEKGAKIFGLIAFNCLVSLGTYQILYPNHGFMPKIIFSAFALLSMVIFMWILSNGYGARRYDREINRQKLNMDLDKERLAKVETLLSCSDDQLAEMVILTDQKIILKLTKKDVSSDGSNIIIPAATLRRQYEDERAKLKEGISENSQEIKEPWFVSFWKKYILSLRMPKLHIASI